MRYGRRKFPIYVSLANGLVSNYSNFLWDGPVCVAQQLTANESASDHVKKMDLMPWDCTCYSSTRMRVQVLRTAARICCPWSRSNYQTSYLSLCHSLFHFSHAFCECAPVFGCSKQSRQLGPYVDRRSSQKGPRGKPISWVGEVSAGKPDHIGPITHHHPRYFIRGFCITSLPMGNLCCVSIDPRTKAAASCETPFFCTYHKRVGLAKVCAKTAVLKAEQQSK